MSAWMAAGACRTTDTEVFFAEEGGGFGRSSNIAAKRICGACPVVDYCLEYALKERIPHGVFGGATPRERGRILVAREIQRRNVHGSAFRNTIRTPLFADAEPCGGPTDATEVLS